MSVFVLEIAGRGILAMAAQSRMDAQARTCESSLEADLLCLENGLVPLWDGSAALQIREPSHDERATFESAALLNHTRNDDLTVFLIPVTDPTTDDVDG